MQRRHDAIDFEKTELTVNCTVNSLENYLKIQLEMICNQYLSKIKF